MAEAKPKIEDAQPEAKQSPATKYPKAQLIANASRWLGHPHYVAAGALKAEKRDTLTIDEARTRVTRWLG